MFFVGSMGMVGQLVSGALLGLLGFGAYVLPFAVIGVAAYALFSQKRSVSYAAFIKAVIFGWCFISLMHIFTSDAPVSGQYDSAWLYITSMYENGRVTNGGLLGALLGNLLRSLLDGGAVIVLAAGGLITLILLTGKSFAAMLTRFNHNVRRYFEALREENEADEEYEYDPDDDPPAPVSTGRKPKFEPLTMEDTGEGARHTENKKILLAKEDFEAPKPKPEGNPIFTNRRIPREPADESNVIYPPWEDAPAYMDAQDAPPDDFAIIKGLDGKNQSEPLFDFDDEEPLHPLPAPKREPVQLSVFDDYQYPSLSLLTKNTHANATSESRAQILENSRILEETLKSFKVEAKVIEVSVGPTVTRYDMAPGPGVKVATIANLSNDLALSLAAQGIRIEAPVPGKSAVGIEIPNKEAQPVLLREIIEDDAFVKFPSRLAFAVGKDIAGSPVVTDIARMPHLLIAGATGSGKSVCINTLIASLLYKSRPDEVKLLMIDPKVVELSVYNGIPHLLIPVVTDPKKASGALSWAVGEMENRYSLFAEAGTRDLKGYNTWLTENDEPELPQIVIIIDELADLMMVCKGEVEESICRLAQKARACGIHLIVATQRPSVDVITGLIKANIPSRLAFAVSSGIDSRTVIDMYGAEKLLGKGDMLFLPMGRSKPLRLQGGFISDKEVEGLVKFLKQQAPAEHTPEMIEAITTPSGSFGPDEAVDEFFHEAVNLLLEKGKGSTSMLQRQFRIGYNRASRLMEELEARGIVGPEDGVKPRKVLITREEYIVNYE
jgi:S-DNA-T family DNA segregation ATPase FtsK/SpoIIIE